jgi:hypothetical protein
VCVEGDLGVNDDPLLIPEAPEAREHMSSSSYMGRLQQVLLSAFVEKVVIRWRFFWMGEPVGL